MKKTGKKIIEFVKQADLPIWISVIIIFAWLTTFYFDIKEVGKFWSHMSLIASIILGMTGILYIIFSHKKNSKNCCEYTDFCKKNFNKQRCIFLLAVCGFILRYFYTLYTDYNVRQHDVGLFDNGSGHLSYIWQLYENNFRLPEGDPRDRWQFYHPPLHHMLEALWLKFLAFCGIPAGNEFYQYIQIPTLIYSSIAMIVIYRILRELNIDGKALVLAFAMVCFNPTFIVMAGSVNNDMLSALFIYASILYTIKWYKEPKMKNIIKIALCVGLGMMTKASTGLIAPAIAVVFIVKFIQQIIAKKPLPYIVQYVVFLVICCPLGLWWSVRNYIKFDMPFNYVAELNKGIDQYIGNLSLKERFTDFSLYQLKSVFIEWNKQGDTYMEFNPFIALFKTSAFGEMNFLDYNPNLDIAPVILFYANLVLIFISFISMIYTLFTKKSKLNAMMKVFLSLIFLTFLGNYIVFCIQYPFTCTMNIRYITPLIVIGTYFIGSMISIIDKSKTKKAYAVKIFTIISIAVCCSASAFTYTALAVSQ